MRQRPGGGTRDSASACHCHCHCHRRRRRAAAARPGPAAAAADPLTILATFTVPAPISVAVRLRRVWYRSAAPIVASKGLHLSSVPKVVDLFMSPRTPRTSNRSLAMLRRPLRYAKMTVASPDRTRIAAARRAASAHARRDFVRTKVGIRL